MISVVFNFQPGSQSWKECSSSGLASRGTAQAKSSELVSHHHRSPHGKVSVCPTLHKDNICINLSKANKILSLFPSEFILWLSKCWILPCRGKRHLSLVDSPSELTRSRLGFSHQESQKFERFRAKQYLLLRCCSSTVSPHIWEGWRWRRVWIVCLL